MEQTNHPPSLAPIADLVRAWRDAWNAHDMRAAAQLLAADADFVTVAGLWMHGREEFLRHHDFIHRTHLRESEWTSGGHAARWVRRGLALVHIEWTITRELDGAGVPQHPRSGVFTWLVSTVVSHPLIVAAHNTNLRADVTHRLHGSRP